ncbi:MAG TPA: heparinase II/III family protein, partial [Bryobacteraceae bacterium]|nr:heparinase II/III family protein [Bryobacteraceae bacterium]
MKTIAAALLLICTLQAQNPLDTLRKAHPRLIATEQDMVRIRKLSQTNPDAKMIRAKLEKKGESILDQAPVIYEIIGPRLLTQSRRALDRIYTLALLYRLDGQTKWRDRAVAEMKAAEGFKDWNPSHFLDTAEMTHAFAIGYDWLYDPLSPDERTWIRRAIIEKGLEPALAIYRANRSWVLATHNWNQVCNGGIGIGALAVAEDEPQRAAEVLKGAIESLPRAMRSYAPDGGWNEGPGYWHYATRYNVYFLASLETALGKDFGLSQLPGFAQAGDFRIDFSSPSGKTFNYADASDSVGSAEEMFWLARRFSQPVYAWQQLELTKRTQSPHALDLMWFTDSAKSPMDARWPLGKVYKGVQTAFLRASWTDPDTLWLGVKGGDNKANHAHLDLGSFVLDVFGMRWAIDFGPDDYNLPGYFGDKRWTYYRLRTESHNVVLIDGENQDPKAAAPIVAERFLPGESMVKIDLTAAYPSKLASHVRTITMTGGRRVAIRDEIRARLAVEALWGMVTAADVTLKGREAVLTMAGKEVR